MDSGRSLGFLHALSLGTLVLSLAACSDDESVDGAVPSRDVGDAAFLQDVGPIDAGFDPEDGGSDASTDAEPMPDAADGSTDAGAEEDAGSDAGTTEVVLSHVPSFDQCTGQGLTFPILPEEAGHFAATRLQPASYPFVVDQVSYDLGGVTFAQCDSRLEHQTLLFVTTSTRPPSHPSRDNLVIETFTITATTGDPNQQRTITLDLSPPVTLHESESLVVAVEMVASSTTSQCIFACDDTGGIPDVDFWSDSASEPYPWSDMIRDYGFTTNFGIRARGR